MSFENQFNESTENKMRQEFLKVLQETAEYWPDLVAMYSGMIKQLTDDGWTDMAARTIVLSNFTAPNLAMLANLKEQPDASE